MRGFSTLELLIAFAIATTSIIASVLVSLGTQPVFQQMAAREVALGLTYDSLQDAVRISSHDFSQARYATPTTNGIYTTQRSGVSVDDDDLEVQITATTTWKDSSGALHEEHDSVHVFDIANAYEASPCTISGRANWRGPITRSSYSLAPNDLFTQSVPADLYTLSDVAISDHVLAIAAGVTGKKTSPTLFFFNFQSASSRPIQHPEMFDNASSSGDGYAALSAYHGIFFAGNAFGSASTATCGRGSCDQLQIFAASTTAPVVRISSLLLSSVAAPFAVTSTGATAAVKSLTYNRGFVYLGLQKTTAGDEFNIVDVRDPKNPIWRSGVPIGRTVNSITTYRNRAYLSTDDPTRELIIVDVADPNHPHVLGSWNAPGSAGFGFGRSLQVRNTTAQFGRSYVNNAPELYSLDVNNPASPTVVASADIGTARNPRSIVSLLSRQSLLFALTDTSLKRWSTDPSSTFTAAGPDLPFAQNVSGASLTCTGNTVFVGESGTGSTPSMLETFSTP